MKLDVVRVQFGEDATNGLLFIDGVFECYTLEDEVRDVKVYSETAIPEGTYNIKFRKEGGFHTKYKARYGNTHYGMLELQDVPNFKYILIHSGNTDEHTAGCILTGSTQQDLDLGKDGLIGRSRDAYKKCYDKIAKPLQAGKEVTIKISKINLNQIVEESVTKLSNKSPQNMIGANDIYEKISEINGNLKILEAKLEGRNIT